MTPYLNPQIKVKDEQVEGGYGWQLVEWTGNGSVGGTININRPINNRLVSFRFRSTSNQFHDCYITVMLNAANNYLLTQMYNETKYIVVNNLTSSSFNLVMSAASGIELYRIWVFDK